ncbi:hypothetical protein MRX96_008653 [Rhipicephalus microplus]
MPLCYYDISGVSVGFSSLSNTTHAEHQDAVPLRDLRRLAGCPARQFYRWQAFFSAWELQASTASYRAAT